MFSKRPGSNNQKPQQQQQQQEQEQQQQRTPIISKVITTSQVCAFNTFGYLVPRNDANPPGTSRSPVAVQFHILSQCSGKQIGKQIAGWKSSLSTSNTIYFQYFPDSYLNILAVFSLSNPGLKLSKKHVSYRCHQTFTWRWTKTQLMVQKSC